MDHVRGVEFSTGLQPAYAYRDLQARQQQRAEGSYRQQQVIEPMECGNPCVPVYTAVTMPWYIATGRGKMSGAENYYSVGNKLREITFSTLIIAGGAVLTAVPEMNKHNNPANDEILNTFRKAGIYTMSFGAIRFLSSCRIPELLYKHCKKEPTRNNDVEENTDAALNLVEQRPQPSLQLPSTHVEEAQLQSARSSQPSIGQLQGA